MFAIVALIMSVVAVINASPIPAAPQLQREHQIQHLQNNLNPNILDPIEAKSDHKIRAGSIDSNYRPDQDSDYPYVINHKEGAPIKAGAADAKVAASDDDAADQNKIMNEISNIIRQNNMKIQNINAKVESPVINEDRNDAKLNDLVPVDLAEPVVNVQDPNNVEQFEKIPRVNERIPVVNREIFKVPNIKQRIPIANDHEGIVYNEPKVHERVPIKDNNEVKLNDLEDTNNVDAVIRNLDERMKQNGEFRSKLHLAKAGAHEHKIRAGSHGEGYRPDLCDNDSCWPMLYDEKQGGHVRAGKVENDIQNHGDLIHQEHHHHQLHRGADMVDKAAKAK